MNTQDLSNKKVWTSRPTKNDPDAVKKVGRIHAFVFHPSKAQLVGFLVKRPDVALMFHREDMFVAFNGFDLLEDDGGHEVIVVRENPEAHGRGATKALGLNLDKCVVWIGLPAMTPSGRSLGMVDSVEFDPKTGRVLSVVTSQGATANTLLGRRNIPGNLMRGFRRGMGAKLFLADEDDDPESLGAVIVDEAALDIPVEGGIAEKAGAATAVATDKAKTTYKKVVRKVKPKAQEAATVAGSAVQKGVYATGRQIARTEGMFGRFKSEFKAAMNGEDGKDGKDAKPGKADGGKGGSDE